MATPSSTLPPQVGAEPYSCPTDPQAWSLADVFVSQNYKLIQPACVYDSLARTVAWALAIREGYSRDEATHVLGFAELPLRLLDQVTILTDTQDPLEVPVSFVPLNPDFTEWHVDANGQPAVTYALRGCFRTSTVVGNRLEVWGGDYPVICLVVEDAENTRVVYALEGHTYTSSATPTRSFLLFGYVSDGLWVWLGTQASPKIEIVDVAQYANERLTIATLYDSEPWDAAWLLERYKLVMQPLPANWQSLDDEIEKQAILDGLNVYVERGGNETSLPVSGSSHAGRPAAPFSAGAAVHAVLHLPAGRQHLLHDWRRR